MIPSRLRSFALSVRHASERLLVETAGAQLVEKTVMLGILVTMIIVASKLFGLVVGGAFLAEAATIQLRVR